MEFLHISVLLNECLENLNINPDGIYVDGTAGGAGHSSEIAKRLSKNGRLLSLDKDPDALKTARERLSKFDNVSVLETDYAYIKDVVHRQGISSVDGVLMDLGVSSFQLDTAERGFSYHKDAPLDMRMTKSGKSAADVVNTYPASELYRIIRDYSEEKYAKSIANNIVKFRDTKPIETTLELVDIIKNSMPMSAKRDANPPPKTFQAIRIEVNSELDNLKEGLFGAFDILKSGGRLCVITFHSLEDRIVKNFYADMAKGCTCPPDFPVCVCGNKPKGKIITKKPIIASDDELEKNQRSRSAKLRVIEKI